MQMITQAECEEIVQRETCTKANIFPPSIIDYDNYRKAADLSERAKTLLSDTERIDVLSTPLLMQYYTQTGDLDYKKLADSLVEPIMFKESFKEKSFLAKGLLAVSEISGIIPDGRQYALAARKLADNFLRDESCIHNKSIAVIVASAILSLENSQVEIVLHTAYIQWARKLLTNWSSFDVNCIEDAYFLKDSALKLLAARNRYKW